MEKDLSLMLLIFAGVILILLFVYSFKTRVRPNDLKNMEYDELNGLDDEKDILTAPKKNFGKHTIIDVEVKTHIEPKLSKRVIEDDFVVLQPALLQKQNIDPPVITQKQPTESKQIPSNFQPSSLLMLHVMPQEGEKFVGYDLLQALLSAKFRFGKMSIFHRHQSGNSEGKILFSVAQVTEPGTFSIDKMGSCQCTGLVLFMQLFGPEHNLAALEIFIQSAQQLADSLGGVVMEKRDSAFTADAKQRFIASVQYHLENSVPT